MTRLIAIARKLLARIFGRHSAVSDGVAAQAPIGHNRRPRVPKRAQTVGEFHFRDSILDQLEHYFRYLKRMKAGDRESYALYQKIGAHIIPYRYPQPSEGKLPGWWAQNQPTFGAVAFAIGEEWLNEERKVKKTSPRFLYFSKFKASKSPGRIEQYANGAVYVLTVYWDDGTKNGTYPAEYAVGIEPDGSVRVLRTLNTSIEHPKARGKNSRRGKPTAIPVRRWGIDPYWKGASEHSTGMGDTPEQFMTNLFCWVAELFERANASMTRIAAKKDGMTALFSVGIERTPYFFRDRDREAGQKKKIFHIVRAHQRDLGDKTSTVRTHFRGERSFDWNGYQIEISVPGWHHFDMMEFNVGGEHRDELVPPEDTSLEGEELAEFLSDAMARGLGGEQSRRLNGQALGA